MKYIKGVTTLAYDKNLCTGCGMCVSVCPHEVFQLVDGRAVLRERDNCMECGACMMNCSASAIRIEKGVGCASAVIQSRLKGRDEIGCDCGGDSGCCC